MDILVVGAHPDDAEIGLGGTLALMSEMGFNCGIVDLTDGEPTPRGSTEVRAAEAAKAAEILGVSRRTLALPNRYLFDTREAREKVAAVFREWRPRIVAVPWWQDAHPDHVAACRIAEAARFFAKFTKAGMPGKPHYPALFVYHLCSHLRVMPQVSLVVDVTATIEKKMAAIEAYESQFGESEERRAFLRGLKDRAALWGGLAQVGAGEPIITREPIGLRNLGALL